MLREDALNHTVAESTIMIEYLDAHYPGATRFVPADRDGAWQTEMWGSLFTTTTSSTRCRRSSGPAAFHGQERPIRRGAERSCSSAKPTA